jgi:VCBS repeat-containing protein
VTEVSPIPSVLPAVQQVSDTLTFVDNSDATTYTVLMESDPAALGSLTASLPNSGADGSIDLKYTIADSAIAFLGAGQTKTDTFYVELSDGLNTTVVPYSVTINGNSEAQQVGNIDLSTTGFALAGAATVSAAAHPDDTTGGNLYQLIPNQTGEAGAIWQPVNLGESFTVHARLFFGDGILAPLVGGSADGITFAPQDQGATAIGPSARISASAGFSTGLPRPASPVRWVSSSTHSTITARKSG